MKKQLFALSLLTTCGLIADDGYCPPEPTISCAPCCTPAPRKCINCEAYNPPFYILQCDWGFFADVEFLYWYSRESNLVFAEKYVSLKNILEEIDTIPYASDYANLKAPWEPGVRAGLGWNMSCDGWDLYLNWTYFHAEKSDSVSADSGTIWPLPGESSIFNPWTNGALFRAITPNWKSVRAEWSLNFNQIDLELGKRYWVSRCFNIRPFVGLRGGWTSTHFDTHSINSNSAPVEYTTTGTDKIRETGTDIQDFTRSKNKFWGVGFSGGMQPNWILGSFCGCGDFSIYGNFEGSIIWGKFKGNKSVRSTYQSCDFDLLAGGPCSPYFNDTGFITGHENLYQMVPILDLAIGIRWEDYWCCDRYYTAIDLGWEHHVWFNHGRRHQDNGDLFFQSTPFTGGIFGSNLNPSLDHANTLWNFNTSSSTVISDLNFGGFVLRVRFEF